MRLFLLAAVSILLSAGCTADKFPGYKEKTKNLYYKRIALGEGINYHPDSAFIDYLVTFSGLDSADKPKLGNGKIIRFARPRFRGKAAELFYGLKSGDHLKLIILNRPDWIEELVFELPEDSVFDYALELWVLDVVNTSDNDNHDPNYEEYKRIMNYLNTGNRKSRFVFTGGIWLDKSGIKPGKRKAEPEVVLDYKGYYLDENIFDRPDYPLKFNRSDRFQVIPGISIALRFMHAGDTAVAIIPSHLAFGEKGSKYGNVPPNEPVLYGLKLLENSSEQ